jgi:diguanylate cyclase (GGDEF)-like protein/PAS domain S-box-containing protein
MSQLDDSMIADLIFKYSDEAILVTDMNNNIVMVNSAFTEVTGYTQEEVIGKNPRLLASGMTKKEVYQEMWNRVTTTGKWTGEVINKKKNGEIYPEWLKVYTVIVKSEIKYHIAIFRDFTEYKQREQAIMHLAYYDHLTGLPNRALFNDRLELAIKNARRNKDRVALMFLDLDQFKIVNDTYGHDIGDELLKQVSGRITAVLRDSDTLARMGGDEFTVILPYIENAEGGLVDAKNIAEKILAVFTEPFMISDITIKTSTSIGIALYQDDADTTTALLKFADTAMYEAKNAGRNTYRFH